MRGLLVVQGTALLRNVSIPGRVVVVVRDVLQSAVAHGEHFLLGVVLDLHALELRSRVTGQRDEVIVLQDGAFQSGQHFQTIRGDLLIAAVGEHQANLSLVSTLVAWISTPLMLSYHS